LKKEGKRDEAEEEIYHTDSKNPIPQLGHNTL